MPTIIGKPTPIQISIDKITFDDITFADINSARAWPQSRVTDKLRVDSTISNSSKDVTVPTGSVISGDVTDGAVAVMSSGYGKNEFFQSTIGQVIVPGAKVSGDVILKWDTEWNENQAGPCSLIVKLWEPSDQLGEGDKSFLLPNPNYDPKAPKNDPDTGLPLPVQPQYKQKYFHMLASGMGWIDISPSPCQVVRSAATPHCDSKFVWENWTKTFKFEAACVYRPTSAAEIAAAVLAAEAAGQPLRAVGSTWSFSDASLPLPDAPSVKAAMEDPTLLDQDIPPPAPPSQAYVLDATFFASSLQDNLPKLLTPEALQSGRHFFHVEAGIKIADLDVLLDHESPRLGLASRGGSNGQTLAGAFSTGTHGGEFGLKPLADYVQAIHLIGPGAVEYWIERSHNGQNLPITTPAQVAAAYPCIDPSHVIYDSEVFNAVLVSMGCMGVIYSVILEAIPQFGIHQVVRNFVAWSDMVADVGKEQDGRVNAAAFGGKLMDGSWCWPKEQHQNTFVGLTVTPYPYNDGNFECWLANRERVAVPIPLKDQGPDLGGLLGGITKEVSRETPGEWWDKLGALINLIIGFVVDLVGSVGGPGPLDLGKVMRKLVKFAHDKGYSWLLRALTRAIFNWALPADKTDVSYTFSSAGFLSVPIAGVSIEMAFPLIDGIHFLEDVVLRTMKKAILENKQYVLGWISLRICGQSDALLGMQQHSPTCFIEVSLLASPDAASIVSQLQTKAIDAGGILHWGQANDQLTPQSVTSMYGAQRLAAWRHVRHDVLGHKQYSTFDNNFTDRCGLLASPSQPAAPTQPDRLLPNQGLMVGKSITSADGRFRLILQADGNLVLYASAGQALWASNTAGHRVWDVVMQGDGNLVIYSVSGQALWASNTEGNAGAWLIAQNDGNVVIYDPGNHALWATNTAQ